MNTNTENDNMLSPILFIKISFLVIALAMAILGSIYVGIAYFNVFPKVRNGLYTIGVTLVVVSATFILLTIVLLR
ncbi:MAG: hypothetical protein QW232_06905 [Saccharolobus sp.]